VVEFNRIAERTASPEVALAHASRVMEKFPQVEIESVAWSVAKDERRDKPAAAPAGAKPAAEGDTAVRLELTGRIHATQRDDYRGITAQVQRFADALASDGYELARTQLPFDITSEGTLTGDIGAAQDRSEAPRFTVTLTRRLP
jgi:hypothetical protein